MFNMHRTTIFLDSQLQKRLRSQAKKQGKTVTELIQNFVRHGLNLSQQPQSPKRSQIKIPSADLGDFLVDISDREQIQSVLEDHEQFNRY